MGKNQVYAQTQTRDNMKLMKKITAKQWKIYYYLLSLSKYNSQKVENHRYLYKSSINITKTCKLLGIKSNQTFYNAIERLEKVHLIRKTDDYFYIYAPDYVEVDKDVLVNLISYSITKNDDEIDLLRTYLILKKLYQIGETPDDLSFTTRAICLLLGHSDTTTIYYVNVKKYLALLSFWGLVELKYHTATNESLGNHYTIYHIQNVKEVATNPDFELDIQGEMNAETIQPELECKLKEQFPWLLN